MTERQKEISKLLSSLPKEYNEGIRPASLENIRSFRLKAKNKGIDKNIIEQLADLYSVADNFMYEVVMGFHPCSSDIIFEWWNEKELWIGQRDFNTLRWSNNKFCLGNASSISYSKKNEYKTLVELIKGGIIEINELYENEKSR